MGHDHGDHDHVHYDQHDCAVLPEDPAGSCAEVADGWEAMTDAEKECQTATLCCEATNGADTANCAIKDGSGCMVAPVLPEYECAGSCHIHSECHDHGDHDHVHYDQHDCAVLPEDPAGSCRSGRWLGSYDRCGEGVPD